jgi:RNA-binding protein 39
VLCKDDFGRSKGYGFIQFSHAEDAKKAMEQLNNFELANRPIKVAPFIEKPTDTGLAFANLDNEELDRSGVNLGPSGKLALMAKLAEGSGIKIPQFTLDAITASANAAAANASVNNFEYNNDSQFTSGISTTSQPTQCFLLSNMFDLAEYNWIL